MTTVQKRLAVAAAALALMASCVFLFALPQHAYADTNLVMSGKNLTATTTFNNTQKTEVVQRYSFKTSGRNSRYKITVRPEKGEITANVVSADLSTVASFTAEGRTTKTFTELERNATYYIGLTVPKYTQCDITVKEVITPPDAVEKLKAVSKVKTRVKTTWRKSFNASGYQVRYKKGSGKWKWATKKTTKKRCVIKGLSRHKTYKIGVRPYRTVNKKNHYGKWTYKTVVVK